MSKKMKISILVTAVLLMVVGFSYLFPSENKDKKPKISESEKSLYKKFLNQDGLHILEELLKNYPQIDSLKVIRDNIDTNLNTEFNNNKPSVYLLMDKDINLTNNSIDTLMQFVENGNVALVAVSQFSSYFSLKLAYSSLTSYVSDDEISLSFEHPDFKMYLPYLFQTIKYERAKYRSWNYFNLENMFTDSDRIVCIGKETYYDNPVFIKVPYGNGYFYLHTIPEVFYNESMFNEDGFEYVQRVFSHLPKGNYSWHQHYNRLDEHVIISDLPPEETVRESPIQYILKDKYLRHAYLILIVGLLVYVIFKVKRRQQIIPTVEPNTNSSLEFLDTVSLLYLKQEKHYKFIKHYQQSFIHFIKDKYYINSPKIDKNYVEQVAQKSGIQESKIIEIFEEFKRAKKSYNYSSEELIALHQKIEYFYKHCK